MQHFGRILSGDPYYIHFLYTFFINTVFSRDVTHFATHYTPIFARWCDELCAVAKCFEPFKVNVCWWPRIVYVICSCAGNSINNAEHRYSRVVVVVSSIILTQATPSSMRASIDIYKSRDEINEPQHRTFFYMESLRLHSEPGCVIACRSRSRAFHTHTDTHTHITHDGDSD